jgi:hypothetical protein
VLLNKRPFNAPGGDPSEELTEAVMPKSQRGGVDTFTRVLSSSDNSNDEFDGLYGLGKFVEEAILRQDLAESTCKCLRALTLPSQIWREKMNVGLDPPYPHSSSSAYQQQT